MVNLGGLVLALSDAMELASNYLAQHQQRTAFIALEMGRCFGWSLRQMEDLFIAALLHDIGAISLEEKIQIHNAEINNPSEHCLRGERLLSTAEWLKPSACLIRNHHTDWQTWKASIEDTIVFKSQILYLADCVERMIRREYFILHQQQDIIKRIAAMAGSAIHPRVVDLFLTVSRTEEFWLDVVSHRLFSILLNRGPLKMAEIEFDHIATVAELFRNVIDFRSRFTATHSSGVAASASILARIFGLTDTEVQLMEVAGDLHDLGKLAIPNSILEKPGSLTAQEMAVMKSHTYYTYAIVHSVDGLQRIAEWAACHHEKLDGSGYPFHCTSAELSTGARILAVADTFTALAEDRPYRIGMSRDDIVQILKNSVAQNALDDKIVRLVLDNYSEIHEYVCRHQSAAKEFYENWLSSSAFPLFDNPELLV
jgi:HD-GYP domain-containing protein (c-di-GMP phosphodiesterase class II)